MYGRNYLHKVLVQRCLVVRYLSAFTAAAYIFYHSVQPQIYSIDYGKLHEDVLYPKKCINLQIL